MTNGEIVSRIVNDLRFLNKDEHISRRYILSIAQSKAKFLMSQKLRDMSLYREENLYRTIRCFPLRQESIVECGILEFRRCEKLMKSVNKLPELIYSRYGGSILSVTTIDGNREFTPITLRQYRLLKDRKYGAYANKYMYYTDGSYLYLPDSDIKAVNVTLLTISESDVEALSECDGYSNNTVGDGINNNRCRTIWEYEFICSDKLLEAVIQDTLNEVASTYRQIVPDENPNLDETQRGKTHQ